MDTLMTQRWWETIGPEDSVLHLGDVFMGEMTAADVPARFPTLPGHVYVVPGNHDGLDKLAALAGIGWLMVEPFSFSFQGWAGRFSHPLIEDLAEGELNVHGHIHQNPAPSPRHFNASVERLDYTPSRLEPTLSALVRVNGGPRSWPRQGSQPK